MLRAPVTEPAILTTMDPRNEMKISPMAKALKKYGTPPMAWRYDIVRLAFESVKQQVMVIPGVDCCVDEHFLLYGDGDGSHRVNMASSAGFPYRFLVKEGGKMGFVELKEDSEYILTKEMRNDVIVRLTSWRDSFRMFTLWMDQLKDERRKKEKILSVATRHFTIPPFDFTLAVRALTLHFVSAFTKHRLKFFSAIGIDTQSYEWHEMISRHASFGRKSFDGDISNFDGMMSGEFIQAFFELVSDWYDEYMPEGLDVHLGKHHMRLTAGECRIMRTIICDEIVHTNQLCINLIYQSHQGNPSGNPLTTVLNTCVNAMYMRYVFYERCDKRGNWKEFSDCVIDTIYGDDNFITVKDNCEDFMSFEIVQDCLKVHGIGYTSARKTQEGGFVDIQEIRFLKSGVGLVYQSFWCPLMDWDTIYEMTNWVRATNEFEAIDQLYDNLENALRFVFFYGETAYDRFVQEINRALKMKNLPIVQGKYFYLMQEYRAKYCR